MLFIGCLEYILIQLHFYHCVCHININQLFDTFISLYASMGWQIIFRQRPIPIASIKYRTLFGFTPPKPSFPFGLTNKTQQYAEQRLLGYIFLIQIIFLHLFV
jgi:hypothetical protein